MDYNGALPLGIRYGIKLDGIIELDIHSYVFLKPIPSIHKATHLLSDAFEYCFQKKPESQTLVILITNLLKFHQRLSSVLFVVRFLKVKARYNSCIGLLR